LKEPSFLYTAIDKAVKEEDMAIYSTNDALRNYIHIDDFTEIISRVIRKRIDGLYSCINELDVSLPRVVKAIFAAFHPDSQVIFIKELEDIQDNTFPYDDSLFKLIKCYPQISIEEGLKKLASYWSIYSAITNRKSVHVK